MDGDRRKLVIASANPHKIEELRAMTRARGLQLDVSSANDHGDAPEIVEDQDTFAGNATLKALGIARWLATLGTVPGDTLVLADDSGVCIDAFGGAPGVYSARFAGPGADDAANNAKLVHELSALGRTESPAHYVCVLVLARVDGAPLDPEQPERRVVRFEGRWHGVARIERRGAGGFGYDPHVWLGWPGPGAKTVAELSREDKAQRSHRGQAMRTLMVALERWLAA